MVVLAAATPIPSDFDLARAPRAEPCRAAGALAPGDIVVCARIRRDIPRGATLPEEMVLPEAAVALPGGGRVAVHGQAGSVGNIPTNRAMVTLSLPF